MRTTLVIAALLVVALGLPGHASHGVQTGDNSDCLDYSVLWNLDGVFSPLAATVTAHAGAYSISSSEGTAQVDFYNADGAWIGWNNGAPSGSAPAGTTSGTICVGLAGTYPDAPAPGATWTFTQ